MDGQMAEQKAVLMAAYLVEWLVETWAELKVARMDGLMVVHLADNSVDYSVGMLVETTVAVKVDLTAEMLDWWTAACSAAVSDDTKVAHSVRRLVAKTAVLWADGTAAHSADWWVGMTAALSVAPSAGRLAGSSAEQSVGLTEQQWAARTAARSVGSMVGRWVA